MFNHVRLSSLAAILGAALLAATAVPRLSANGFNNNQTTTTFSAPVEISGEALPAGTYVFKTYGGDRDLVMVMNSDQTRLVALINAIPIDAPAISDKTRVDVSEGAPNGPEVVHAWFYPGERTGWEFPTAKTGERTALAE